MEHIDNICSDDEQEDHVEELEEFTDSEQSADEELVQELSRIRPYYTGKDKTTKRVMNCQNAIDNLLLKI